MCNVATVSSKFQIEHYDMPIGDCARHVDYIKGISMIIACDVGKVHGVADDTNERVVGG